MEALSESIIASNLARFEVSAPDVYTKEIHAENVVKN